MNLVYLLHEPKALILMYQLGYKNNKKEGQGLAEEAIEVQRRHPEWITVIGNTDMDIDQLTGELRENGKKVLNMSEIERQRKNEDKSS